MADNTILLLMKILTLIAILPVAVMGLPTTGNPDAIIDEGALPQVMLVPDYRIIDEGALPQVMLVPDVRAALKKGSAASTTLWGDLSGRSPPDGATCSNLNEESNGFSESGCCGDNDGCMKAWNETLCSETKHTDGQCEWFNSDDEYCGGPMGSDCWKNINQKDKCQSMNVTDMCQWVVPTEIGAWLPVPSSLTAPPTGSPQPTHPPTARPTPQPTHPPTGDHYDEFHPSPPPAPPSSDDCFLCW